jgi:hypothetical protein
VVPEPQPSTPNVTPHHTTSSPLESLKTGISPLSSTSPSLECTPPCGLQSESDHQVPSTSSTLRIGVESTPSTSSSPAVIPETQSALPSTTTDGTPATTSPLSLTSDVPSQPSPALSALRHTDPYQFLLETCGQAKVEENHLLLFVVILSSMLTLLLLHSLSLFANPVREIKDDDLNCSSHLQSHQRQSLDHTPYPSHTLLPFSQAVSFTDVLGSVKDSIRKVSHALLPIQQTGFQS